MNCIIALDTATENCSATLWHQNRLLSMAKIAPQKHADLILKMVDELLTKAEISREEIDGIAFDCGPGSFTGVRISVAAAQGLALGFEAQCLGISSLEAMAFEALQETENGRCLSAIDARMGEVYLGLFEKRGGVLTEVGESLVLKPKEALSRIAKEGFNAGTELAGTGIAVLCDHGYQQERPLKVQYPDAKAILLSAMPKFEQGLGGAPEEAEPLYLRNEVAWKKIP